VQGFRQKVKTFSVFEFNTHLLKTCLVNVPAEDAKRFHTVVDVNITASISTSNQHQLDGNEG